MASAPKMGKYGMLDVTIVETRGVKLSSVSVSCEVMERGTKPRKKKNEADVRYDESFQFPLNRESPNVTVTAWRKNLLGKEKAIGVVTIQGKDIPKNPKQTPPGEWYAFTKPQFTGIAADVVVQKKDDEEEIDESKLGQVRLVLAVTTANVEEELPEGIVLEGEWADDSNGGNIIANKDWFENPQFMLTASCKTKVAIGLHQKGETQHNATFYVLKYDDADFKGRKKTFFSNEDIIKTEGEFLCPVFGKDLRESYMLEEGTYVVIPCLSVKRSEAEAPAKGTFTVFAYADPIQRISFTSLNTEDKKWHRISCDGEWTEETSGGADRVNPQWMTNPQFALTLSKKADCCFVVEQADADKSIGLYVMKTDDPNHRALFFVEQLARTKACAYACTSGVAQPNVPAGSYVVVPNTFEIGEVGAFTVRAYSSDPDMKFTALTREWKNKKTVKGRWHGSLAGGSPNHETFVDNPQYALGLTPTGKGCSGRFILQLTQHETRKSKVENAAIGIVVIEPEDFECDDPFLVEPEDLTPENVLCQTKGWDEKRTVFCVGQADEEEGTDCVVIPSTFKPKMNHKFVLSVYSDCDIDFKAIKRDDDDEEEEDE